MADEQDVIAARQKKVSDDLVAIIKKLSALLEPEATKTENSATASSVVSAGSATVTDADVIVKGLQVVQMHLSGEDKDVAVATWRENNGTLLDLKLVAEYGPNLSVPTPLPPEPSPEEEKAKEEEAARAAEEAAKAEEAKKKKEEEAAAAAASKPAGKKSKTTKSDKTSSKDKEKGAASAAPPKGTSPDPGAKAPTPDLPALPNEDPPKLVAKMSLDRLYGLPELYFKYEPAQQKSIHTSGVIPSVLRQIQAVDVALKNDNWADVQRMELDLTLAMLCNFLSRIVYGEENVTEFEELGGRKLYLDILFRRKIMTSLPF